MKFTKEFIEAQLALRDCISNAPLRFPNQEAVESAYNNYPAALAEIQRLQERVAELEAQQEWHPCSEPPDDGRWVLVEVVYAHAKKSNIVPGWYDKMAARWNIEHNGYSNILRWRELLGGGKNE